MILSEGRQNSAFWRRTVAKALQYDFLLPRYCHSRDYILKRHLRFRLENYRANYCCTFIDLPRKHAF